MERVKVVGRWVLRRLGDVVLVIIAVEIYGRLRGWW
jgi:hypothetical protein